MKTGLVLEGGAMRGMYTAGVLDVFLDCGIRFDGIMGVSAGALFGVNYLSGQRGRAIRYNKTYNHDKNYMGLRPLLREGNIVSTEYAYERVPRELDPFDDAAYMASGVPFYAVVTSLETGQAEYMEVKSVFAQMDVLRASGSMPYVSQPVNLNGHLYLDGGCADSIPWRKMREMGYEQLVVVLTRDASYRKKPSSARPARLLYHKYPAFSAALARRSGEYNESVEALDALAAEGGAFLIRPSEPITISRMESDPDRLEEVYQLGIRDAHAALLSPEASFLL